MEVGATVLGLLFFVFLVYFLYLIVNKDNDEEIKNETKPKNETNDIEKEQILQQMERNILDFFSYEELIVEVDNDYAEYEYNEVKEEIVSYHSSILWKHNGKSYYNKDAITPKIFYEEEFDEYKLSMGERYEYYKKPKKYYNGYVIMISVSHKDCESLKEAERKREICEHMHPEIKRNRMLKEQNELLNELLKLNK